MVVLQVFNQVCYHSSLENGDLLRVTRDPMISLFWRIIYFQDKKRKLIGKQLWLKNFWLWRSSLARTFYWLGFVSLSWGSVIRASKEKQTCHWLLMVDNNAGPLGLPVKRKVPYPFSNTIDSIHKMMGSPNSSTLSPVYCGKLMIGPKDFRCWWKMG